MDILTLLRRRTRERHARLDAGIGFHHPPITRERYVAFLRGVLAAVTPLERALVPWLGPFPGPSRVDALGADLAALGAFDVVDSTPTRIPRNVSEAYGCAYVLEGSSLGGVVLAPLVEESLGPGVPTAYLRLRGADTGKAWRAWLARLHAFGVSATQDDVIAACEMACAAFDAYAASLRRTGAFQERFACTP